jgi:hypothetical protein
MQGLHQLMGHPEQSGPELWHEASALSMGSSCQTAVDWSIRMTRRLVVRKPGLIDRRLPNSAVRPRTAKPKTGGAGAPRRYNLHRRRSQTPFSEPRVLLPLLPNVRGPTSRGQSQGGAGAPRRFKLHRRRRHTLFQLSKSRTS